MATEELSDVLSEFARTIVTDFPIQAILDHLVRRIVEIMPVTAAGVTLISPGLDPRYVAASNDSALRFEMLQTELGEGPCLAAYHHGEAIAVPDLRNEERFPTFSPRALDAGLAAVFAFPLHHGDSQLGALDLYRDTPGALSPEVMGTAQTLADVAAAYLLNAQLSTTP
jgi:GAF domain-containing protein